MSALDEPLVLTNAHGTVTLHRYGAHVRSWTPAREDAVLFLSQKSSFETGKPIRGGIPICFPWFGPGRSGDMAPAHGFARISTWELVEHAQDTAVLQLTPAQLDDDARAAFPHDFAARLSVSPGERSLQVSLTVENTGQEAFDWEEALHTYFTVGDIRQVTVTGLEQAEYLDKVGGAAERPATGEPIRFEGETDRVYRGAGPVEVRDAALGRLLRITTTGARNTVVWNPWVDKAAAMADFGDHEWPRMLCIEGANALESAVRLAPGESHELGYAVEVADL